MSDNLKEASVMLDQWCAVCQRSANCAIKTEGESPSVADIGLPVEWGMGGCTEFAAIDTESGDLFA